MTNILMHFKYDSIYMNIGRFEISLDLGKYIEHYCEQTGRFLSFVINSWNILILTLTKTIGIDRPLNVYMLIKMIAAYQ